MAARIAEHPRTMENAMASGFMLRDPSVALSRLRAPLPRAPDAQKDRRANVMVREQAWKFQRAAQSPWAWWQEARQAWRHYLPTIRADPSRLRRFRLQTVRAPVPRRCAPDARISAAYQTIACRRRAPSRANLGGFSHCRKRLPGRVQNGVIQHGGAENAAVRSLLHDHRDGIVRSAQQFLARQIQRKRLTLPHAERTNLP